MSEKGSSRIGALLSGRKGKTLAVTLAVVGAFSVGMASTAVAANGMPFTLGRENVAKAVTTLTKQGPGAALNLVVRDGEPPMRVNSDARVVNLNADKVDGLNAKELRGQTGPEGPQGEQGIRGEQGEQGEPGLDGTGVLSGTGAPPETLGANGDFYLDSENSDLYGPKTADGWGDPVSLVGPEGEQGDPGAQGIQGEPGEQGEQGERGVQGESGEQGERGDPGSQGIQGVQGEAGTDGTDGNSVLSGEGPPAADFGRVGDFYVDVRADEIYGPKSAEGWANPTSIVGPQGEQGIQGEQGLQGEQGEQGPEGPSGSGTSENTPNTVVGRDANGNFSAGTITANVNGTAANATTAQNLQGDTPDDFLPSGRFGDEWHEKGGGGINGGANNNYCTVGEVKLFAGNFPPPGTAFADGQTLQIQQYGALYTILGVRYGGDGNTTFALPDLYGLGPGGTSYTICVEGLFPTRP